MNTHHFLSLFSCHPCSQIRSPCRRCSDRGAPPRMYSSTWARKSRSSSARPRRQSALDTGIPGAMSWRNPSSRDSILPITQKTTGGRLISTERARRKRMKSWLRLFKSFGLQKFKCYVATNIQQVSRIWFGVTVYRRHLCVCWTPIPPCENTHTYISSPSSHQPLVIGHLHLNLGGV